MRLRDYAPLGAALVMLARVGPTGAAPASEKQLQPQIRRQYSAMEQGWKQRRPAAVAALWTADFTETWPDSEHFTRQYLLENLETNLGNRGSTWTRTHQILGVKLLPGGEEAEVWVRTRTRGAVPGEKWKISISQGWAVNRSTSGLMMSQATTELHTWLKTPAGWRLRAAFVKKSQ